MQTVDELRSELMNLGMSEEEVAAMRKPELRQKLIELMHKEADETIEFNLFENAEESQAQGLEAKTVNELLPVKYGSEKWTEYIMGLFHPDELSDGCPKCNGLRRVAQLVLGDIVSSRTVGLTVLPTEPRSVTVNYEIEINWKLNTYVDFGNLDQFQDRRVFGGLADCVEDTYSVFGRHPAATAESKAEARALRKALALNVVTAEEKIAGQDENYKTVSDVAKITTAMKMVIVGKANALNLDLASVMKEYFNTEDNDTDLDRLTMEDGRGLFDFINKYQRH